MLLSSMKASLMAIMPTEGMRYQHGWPRRVLELSMMSSLTRKKAWRSSIIQPRVAARKNSSEERERERREVVVSTTERPRLHFPPRVLWVRDCLTGLVYQSIDVVGMSVGFDGMYLFEPAERLVGKSVFLAVFF